MVNKLTFNFLGTNLRKATAYINRTKLYLPNSYPVAELRQGQHALTIIQILRSILLLFKISVFQLGNTGTTF